MIYESTRKMSVKEQEAYDLGYLNGKEAALRGPQPDPITGLVPCGCGGVARVAVQYAYPDERRVFCERCGLTTIWLCAPMSVLQFHWNRAMGCREVKNSQKSEVLDLEVKNSIRKKRDNCERD